MIIWGSRAVTSTKSRGTFYCMTCSAECAYEFKSIRRFFTLYFIPLIPLDSLGEFVECGGCRNTFRPEVLSQDPREAQKKWRGDLVAALCVALGRVAGADGALNGAEVAAAIAGLRREFNAEESDNLLESKLSRAGIDFPDLSAAMAVAVEGLTDKGKELALQLAGEVARAGSGGELSEPELRAMREIGEALRMTAAHLRGVLAEQQELRPA